MGAFADFRVKTITSVAIFVLWPLANVHERCYIQVAFSAATVYPAVALLCAADG